MRKALVTGGCGFIGSNLAKRLVKEGHQVIIIDNLMENYGGNLFNIFDFSDNLISPDISINLVPQIYDISSNLTFKKYLRFHGGREKMYCLLCFAKIMGLPGWMRRYSNKILVFLIK